MKRLTKLANKYKTDKGSDYWYAHGFAEFYEPFLEKFEHPTILEIGTAEGSSSKMFNEFFDGDCTIYTLDIDPNCREKVAGYDNIKFYNVDCSDEAAIIKFLNEETYGIDFDIIIDDGSHFWEQQMLGLYLFSQKLKNGGIYILEDLHTSYSGVPNKNYDKSPLYFINFFEGGVTLYQSEKEELVKRLKDVIIFNRYNEKNEVFHNYRSVTAVITFKDK